MKKVASLRYGVVFKKAFSDPEIFTAFARDFVGIDLEIDEVETEKAFDPPIGRVASHFDLFAEDKKNRVIVDIQHVRYPDHYDRFLYYHCVALLELVASHKNYRPRTKVYTLVILTSGDKHKTDISTIDFDPIDRDGNHLGEIDHKIIYICPKYMNETTPVAYQEWMKAIEDSLDGEVEESDYKQVEVRKIFDLIENDALSPYDRAAMKEEYNIGEKMIENYDEGYQKGVLQTAVNMLSKGMSPALISEITGMLETAVLELQQESS